MQQSAPTNHSQIVGQDDGERSNHRQEDAARMGQSIRSPIDVENMQSQSQSSSGYHRVDQSQNPTPGTSAADFNPINQASQPEVHPLHGQIPTNMPLPHQALHQASQSTNSTLLPPYGTNQQQYAELSSHNLSEQYIQQLQRQVLLQQQQQHQQLLSMQQNLHQQQHQAQQQQQNLVQPQYPSQSLNGSFGLQSPAAGLSSFGTWAQFGASQSMSGPSTLGPAMNNFGQQPSQQQQQLQQPSTSLPMHIPSCGGQLAAQSSQQNNNQAASHIQQQLGLPFLLNQNQTHQNLLIPHLASQHQQDRLAPHQNYKTMQNLSGGLPPGQSAFQQVHVPQDHFYQLQQQMNLQNHGIGQEQANMITEGERASILAHASRGLDGEFGSRNQYYATYSQDIVDSKAGSDANQQSFPQAQNLASLQHAQLLHNHAAVQPDINSGHMLSPLQIQQIQQQSRGRAWPPPPGMQEYLNQQRIQQHQLLSQQFAAQSDIAIGAAAGKDSPPTDAKNREEIQSQLQNEEREPKSKHSASGDEINNNHLRQIQAISFLNSQSRQYGRKQTAGLILKSTSNPNERDIGGDNMDNIQKERACSNGRPTGIGTDSNTLANANQIQIGRLAFEDDQLLGLRIGAPNHEAPNIYSSEGDEKNEERRGNDRGTPKLLKERGQSAPPKFEQSSIDHFGEETSNEFFTKQFTQGNIQERMDPQYWEFYRANQELQQSMKHRPAQNEMKMDQLPLRVLESNSDLAQNSKVSGVGSDHVVGGRPRIGQDLGRQTHQAIASQQRGPNTSNTMSLVKPITAEDEEEMLQQLKAQHETEQKKKQDRNVIRQSWAQWATAAPLDAVYQRRESSLSPKMTALIISFNDQMDELTRQRHDREPLSASHRFDEQNTVAKGLTAMGPKASSQSNQYERGRGQSRILGNFSEKNGAQGKLMKNLNQTNTAVAGGRRLRRLSTISSDRNKRDCGLINKEANSKQQIRRDAENDIKTVEISVKDEVRENRVESNEQAAEPTSGAAQRGARVSFGDGSQVQMQTNFQNQNQQIFGYRRRESSYTDALDDPIRYLDQVKKFLGTAGEDDDLALAAQQAKHGRDAAGSFRRRNRSGSFFIQGNNIGKSLLEEINEESLPIHNDHQVIKPKEVDYIKTQFQQFSLTAEDQPEAGTSQEQLFRHNDNSPDSQPTPPGLSNPDAHTKTQHLDRPQQIQTNDQDLVPPAAHQPQQVSNFESECTKGFQMQALQNDDRYAKDTNTGRSEQNPNPQMNERDSAVMEPEPHTERNKMDIEDLGENEMSQAENVDLSLPVTAIAKKFGLASTYETLEGHSKLSRSDLLGLLEYSPTLSKDQGGCRLLQKYIQRAGQEKDQELFDHIFERSMPCCAELMIDGFGNYLIQKLAENCSDEQLTRIIQAMEVDAISVCKDAHGTRSVQKIVEIIQHQSHFKLLQSYLCNHIKEMSEDINCNHVIQKILNSWPPAHNQFLYDAMCKQCVEIACHKQGCCIMQKCIDASTLSQRRSLTLAIAQNTLIFVKNPFANYVVQYVLKLKIEEINQVISQQLMTDLIAFSKQKFSSNVIEKCLEFNTQSMNQEMVECLMANEAEYFNLLGDQYGNYVIQKCLHVAVEPQFSAFIEKLRDSVDQLAQSDNDFGVKIHQRLVKKYPQLEGPPGSRSNYPLKNQDYANNSFSQNKQHRRGAQKYGPNPTSSNRGKQSGPQEHPPGHQSQGHHTFHKNKNFTCTNKHYDSTYSPYEGYGEYDDFGEHHGGQRYEEGQPHNAPMISGIGGHAHQKNLNINININMPKMQSLSSSIGHQQQKNQMQGHYSGGYQKYKKNPHQKHRPNRGNQE